MAAKTITDVNKDVGSLGQKSAELETTIAEVKAEFGKLFIEFIGLKERIADLKENISDLREKTVKRGEDFAALKPLLDNLSERANATYDDHRETVKKLEGLRRKSEKQDALLNRDVKELQRIQDRWGQRLWMILAPVIAGVIGSYVGIQLGLKKDNISPHPSGGAEIRPVTNPATNASSNKGSRHP